MEFESGIASAKHAEIPPLVTPGSPVPSVEVLGVPISLVDLQAAAQKIIGWAAAGQSHYVCVRDVHGVMQAQEDPALLAIHQNAGMITPDGMPLVWLARRWGDQRVARTAGFDLLSAVCDRSREHGLRHFFYGGREGVAERLAEKLRADYPGLQVVGTYTPPFRPLSEDEDRVVIDEINVSGADIVWVGLSTPKQEYWMRDHVGRIEGATLVGIGAAYDFHVGDVKRAPPWMRDNGFEWLHRLVSEPRRLWRRYLVMAPKFVFLVLRSRGRG
jgi:N-acetylglucosaminyldiphosphoundecaprenol N-acetyl-beta-D-mannosaminyltransferase